METIRASIEHEPTYVKAGYYFKVNVLRGSASQLDPLSTRIGLIGEEIKARLGSPRHRMAYRSGHIARHALFHHAIGTSDIASLKERSNHKDEMAFTFGTIVRLYGKLQESRRSHRSKSQPYDLGLILSDFIEADPELGAHVLLAAHDPDVSRAVAKEGYFVNLAGMDMQPIAMGTFCLLPPGARQSVMEAMAEIDPEAGSMFVRDVSGNFEGRSNKDAAGFISQNWQAAEGAIKEIYGKDVTVLQKIAEVQNEKHSWTDILPSA